MSCEGCRKARKCKDYNKVDGCELYIGKDDYRECYICGGTWGIQEHHCISGSNRKNADRWGLTVDLCAECHINGRKSAHKCHETQLMLMQKAQRVFLNRGHTMDEWMEIFHKNWLED